MVMAHGLLVMVHSIRRPYTTDTRCDIRNSCVEEKNGKIKIVCNFSEIKLCFVINVLNIKTV